MSGAMRQADGDPGIAAAFRDFKESIESTFYPEPADLDKTTQVPTVCPGCRIPFDTGRLRDRQAKGFDQCIDCMIADGREHDLDQDDANDYGEGRWLGRIDQ